MGPFFEALLRIFAWPAGFTVILGGATLVFVTFWAWRAFKDKYDGWLSQRITNCVVGAVGVILTIGAYKTETLLSIPVGGALGLAFGLVLLLSKLASEGVDSYNAWYRCFAYITSCTGVVGILLLQFWPHNVLPDLAVTAPQTIAIMVTAVGVLLGCLITIVEFVIRFFRWFNQY